MIVTLDWETAYSDDYSLKKMTTEAYVRDPRFKAHGLAIKFGDRPAQWFPPSVLGVPKMRRLIETSAVLAHHAQFDGLILNHHFDLRPALWLDTLSMARIAVPHERHSLDNLSKVFGLPGKQFQKLADVKGVRDPAPMQLASLGEMACDDADKTYKIFQAIKDAIPKDEFKIIDWTVRMFTEPVLRLDEPKMRVYHGEVVKQKADTLAELGLTKKDLGQDEIVAAKYRALGVEPDQKTTGKGNTKYAFAKTDQFMRDMLEDEDERVAALTAARLGIKSSINETRCERLLSMNSRGPLAVYLRYAGAHPTRWSGGDNLNWQNFPRSEKDGRSGEIRGSIIAPPNKAIVVADLSQIEARLCAWLAGQWDLVEKFRIGADPYVDIASTFYQRTITKADKPERGLGKLAILSMGYGAGGPSVVETAKRGTYGPSVYLTDAQGEEFKNLYRRAYPMIPKMWWETAEQALRVLEARTAMTWGPMEIDDGAIWLPNGLPLWYDKFKREGISIKGDGELWCWIRGQWRRLWGSKLVQHVCEALARTIISQAAIRIEAETGLRPINTVHDELWWLAPLDEAPAALDTVLRELKRTPDWAPNLPLDAEGFWGVRYAK